MAWGTALSPKDYGWILGVSGGGGLPTPTLQFLSDGSIVPTKGTAGTFTRASSFLYGATKNSLATVASGNPACPAFPYSAAAPSWSVGGLYMTSGITNFLIRSSEFDAAAWTANGTGSVVGDSTTDPEGTSTADTIVGAAANDGVQQDSGVAAGSIQVVFSVWLKANTGSRTVSVIVKDQAGSPASATTSATVTTSWQQFSVFKAFSGATGNIVCEIKVNDTTGYSIYAYGAGLYKVHDASDSTELDINWNMTPTITTNAATVSLAGSTLKFTGTELTTSTNKKTIVAWIYVPTYNTGNIWNNKIIFQTEAAAFAVKQGIMLAASGATIQAKYAGGAYANTGDALPAGMNQLVLCVDGAAGDNETYLNGVSIHTDATTFAAETLANFYLSNSWSDGSGPRNNMDSIHGWTEVYIGTRLSSSQVLSLYNAQKGYYGL